MLSIEKQLLYLISSTDRIDVKLLVDIYEARGVSHQIIRNALTRLKKGSYVDSVERSHYSITFLGREFIKTINKKPDLYKHKWDKTWNIVMFEVPESLRKKRDSIRNDILQLGFGSLYNGVYISPWNYSTEILSLCDYYGISNFITIVKGSFSHNDITPDKINKIWSLGDIEELYQRKKEWFDLDFKPEIERILNERPDDDLALLVRFLELGDTIAELGLRDPMLPDDLLPANWSGKVYYEEFNHCLKIIAGSIPENSTYHSFVRFFRCP